MILHSSDPDAMDISTESKSSNLVNIPPFVEDAKTPPKSIATTHTEPVQKTTEGKKKANVRKFLLISIHPNI